MNNKTIPPIYQPQNRPITLGRLLELVQKAARSVGPFHALARLLEEACSSETPGAAPKPRVFAEADHDGLEIGVVTEENTLRRSTRPGEDILRRLTRLERIALHGIDMVATGEIRSELAHHDELVDAMRKVRGRGRYTVEEVQAAAQVGAEVPLRSRWNTAKGLAEAEAPGAVRDTIESVARVMALEVGEDEAAEWYHWAGVLRAWIEQPPMRIRWACEPRIRALIAAERTLPYAPAPPAAPKAEPASAQTVSEPRVGDAFPGPLPGMSTVITGKNPDGVFTAQHVSNESAPDTLETLAAAMLAEETAVHGASARTLADFIVVLERWQRLRPDPNYVPSENSWKCAPRIRLWLGAQPAPGADVSVPEAPIPVPRAELLERCTKAVLAADDNSGRTTIGDDRARAIALAVLTTVREGDPSRWCPHGILWAYACDECPDGLEPGPKPRQTGMMENFGYAREDAKAAVSAARAHEMTAKVEHQRIEIIGLSTSISRHKQREAELAAERDAWRKRAEAAGVGLAPTVKRPTTGIDTAMWGISVDDHKWHRYVIASDIPAGGTSSFYVDGKLQAYAQDAAMEPGPTPTVDKDRALSKELLAESASCTRCKDRGELGRELCDEHELAAAREILGWAKAPPKPTFGTPDVRRAELERLVSALATSDTPPTDGPGLHSFVNRVILRFNNAVMDRQRLVTERETVAKLKAENDELRNRDIIIGRSDCVACRLGEPCTCPPCEKLRAERDALRHRERARRWLLDVLGESNAQPGFAARLDALSRAFDEVSQTALVAESQAGIEYRQRLDEKTAEIARAHEMLARRAQELEAAQAERDAGESLRADRDAAFAGLSQDFTKARARAEKAEGEVQALMAALAVKPAVEHRERAKTLLTDSVLARKHTHAEEIEVFATAFAEVARTAAEPEKQRANAYWKQLCDTMEALECVVPESAPHSVNWAKKIRAELVAGREEIVRLQAELVQMTSAHDLARSMGQSFEREAASRTEQLEVVRHERSVLQSELSDARRAEAARFDRLFAETLQATEVSQQKIAELEDELAASQTELEDAKRERNAAQNTAHRLRGAEAEASLRYVENDRKRLDQIKERSDQRDAAVREVARLQSEVEGYADVAQKHARDADAMSVQIGALKAALRPIAMSSTCASCATETPCPPCELILNARKALEPVKTCSMCQRVHPAHHACTAASDPTRKAGAK